MNTVNEITAVEFLCDATGKTLAVSAGWFRGHARDSGNVPGMGPNGLPGFPEIVLHEGATVKMIPIEVVFSAIRQNMGEDAPLVLFSMMDKAARALDAAERETN